MAGLLPPECDECPVRECDRSIGIDSKGRGCRGDDPAAAVTWPACPWKWGAVWRWGAELLPPSEVVRWLVERGTHRSPRLSAAGASLYRGWTQRADLPARLREARVLADADDARKRTSPPR